MNSTAGVASQVEESDVGNSPPVSGGEFGNTPLKRGVAAQQPGWLVERMPGAAAPYERP
jgi:hypothetical protein